MDTFTTLKWEGKDLYEVRRGDGGRKFVRGLSGEAITEEKTASFDAVPPPAMGGSKINPDDPDDDVSDT